MTDKSDDGEPDDYPLPVRKKSGGKIIKSHGKKPHHRLDRLARGGASGNGSPKKFIASAIKHPGALHKSLGVPQGEKIPAKKLEKATHSSNPTLRKRAALAETLKGFHKK